MTFSFSGSYIEHTPAGPAWLTTDVTSGLHLLSHVARKGIDDGLELSAEESEGLHNLIRGMIKTMNSVDAMVDEWRQDRRAAADEAGGDYSRGFTECQRKTLRILKVCADQAHTVATLEKLWSQREFQLIAPPDDGGPKQ